MNNVQIMNNLKDAFIKVAKVVNDNFDKDVSELNIEYKYEDGDTARTVIDIHA